MTERASFVSIVRNDFTASLAVLGPAVIWAMAVAFRFLSNAEAADYLWLAEAATLVAVPILLWRVSFIRNVIDEGIDAQGTVLDSHFFRGRGRVTYVYSYLGDKLQTSNAVQHNKLTAALTQGSSVTIALDPNNPKRAFIRRLYI